MEDRIKRVARGAVLNTAVKAMAQLYPPAADLLAILSNNPLTQGNQFAGGLLGAIWTGATNVCVYDGQNRVVQTIDPDGGTNSVVYNEIGKQAQTIDKLGHVTRYEYDAQGRLFRTTYPDQTTETSAYDSNGNRTSSVDRAGHTTTYVFDALNRHQQTKERGQTVDRTEFRVKP